MLEMLLLIVFIAIFIVASCVKVVPQAHAFVIERLGAYQGTWNVGIHFKN